MSEIKRSESNARVSRALIHNGVAYVSGLVAPDRSQAIEGQRRQVLARLNEYLEKAGTNRSNLLSVQRGVKDMLKILMA